MTTNETPEQSTPAHDEAAVTLTDAEWRTVIAALVFVGQQAERMGHHEAALDADNLGAKIASQADPERWAFANALIDVLSGVAR
ncbi:hypothetical protein K8F61_17335 [Microbacterium resistens]|uniref:Uncharacterized protein n=1 Tax=Microbacterium resistens TaxID=156977 RepID=A0ABY3RQI0_9MICO|nr:hypothetical protein [Microbacterium resistens]UGS26368.1 hypothetical protein K8F61_17335 [Microbacterium resistens]